MQEPRTPRPLNPRTLAVLVVDANNFNRALIGEILRNLGVSNLSAARSAELALNSLRERPADLILASWDEADPFDPLAFVCDIRRHDDDRTRRLPILLVTASLTRNLVLAGRDAGVDEFLMRPISPAALRQRLEMVVVTPRPFIESAIYAGPCRRRKNPADYHGAKRRSGEKKAPLIDQDEVARATPIRKALTQLREMCKRLDHRTPETITTAVAQAQSARAIATGKADQVLSASLAMFENHISTLASRGPVDPTAIASMLASLEQLASLPQNFKEARESVSAALGHAIQQKQAA